MSSNMDFYKNIMAFLIGFIFLSDLFAVSFSLLEIKSALIMGYLSLSVYHGFIFAASKLNFDMFSLMMIWLLPVVLVFVLAFSLIFGLVVSVPKFIISGYKWNEARKQKKEVSPKMNFQNESENTYLNQVNKDVKRCKKYGENVVPFSPKKSIK